jgi:polysaccharide export outer membrane protein
MRFLLLIATIFCLSACVPNKRLVYLQTKHEPKRGAVSNADTTKRYYKTYFEEYVLKPRDIISIRIGSITPAEFDFVQKYEEQLGLIRKLNQYDQASKNQGQRSSAQGGNGDAGLSSITLDRLQSGFVLDDEGNLELPYIGTIKLSGISVPEAELVLKQKLRGYFETPVVRVQLLSFHFTILGEVNKEGRYTTFDPNSTVIDAISISENLTDFADRSKIKIVRTRGDEAEVFYVNTLSEDLLGQPGFYLRPNDVIIVPPLPARAARKYALPTYATTISLITSTLAFVLFLTSQ